MANIRDVAKRASVAPMTVSRVINQPETVAPATRARVEEAIAELRYVPNMVGQTLLRKQTMVIALVVTDLSNPSAIQQILGVTTAARERGYTVIFAHTAGSADEEAAQLRNLVERRVDGIVLSPVDGSDDPARFVREQRLPVVVLDQPVAGCDVVRVDLAAAARELTERLIALGHRDIALMAGPAASEAERVTGYTGAMSDAGLEPRIDHGADTAAAGEARARLLLEDAQRPSALVAASNALAVGSARAAEALGIAVPGALSIVTFDAAGPDMVPDPFFSGVVPRAGEMATRAAEMLIERISGAYDGPARDEIVPVVWEERASVAPVRN